MNPALWLALALPALSAPFRGEDCARGHAAVRDRAARDAKARLDKN